MTEHSGSNPVKLMSLLLKRLCCISKLNVWDYSLAVKTGSQEWDTP